MWYTKDPVQCSSQTFSAEWLPNEGKDTESRSRPSQMIQSGWRINKLSNRKNTLGFPHQPWPLKACRGQEETLSQWSIAVGCPQPGYWEPLRNKSKTRRHHFLKHSKKNLNIAWWNDALFCVIACLIKSRQLQLTLLALNYCQTELFCEVELNQQFTFTYKN